MRTDRTVLASSRQTFLGLPAFCGGVCVLAAAGGLAHGLPHDTATRVALGLFVAASVGCLVWFLTWRHRRPASLTIDQDAIVMSGFDGGERKIIRRPDSRLRVEMVGRSRASLTSFAGNVLYDEAVGDPRIPVDIYGVERVREACREHGWSTAES